MPDDALEALRERAAKRHLSLPAYAREVLVREAARVTMDETLARPRVIAGRRVTARELKQLIRAGRAQVLVTDAGAWVRALLDENPDGPVRTRLRQGKPDAPTTPRRLPW